MSSLRKCIKSPVTAALFISILVFMIVMGLRLSGSLEFLELAAYDWFIRFQPKSPGSDPRIAIIGVSEQDIRSKGRWPLTDATLAQVFAILAKQKPRAIGMDIFRDVSVPPGGEKLDAILTKNPNIIAVTTLVKGGVPPPAVLKNTDQFGFNDILVDPGGTVRRGLLFMGDGERIYYSFAYKLAVLYLKEEGILPQPAPSNPQHLRLGRVTIRPFESNDGGYIKADARGYQFLLDFKNTMESFPTYPLMSLLSGKIPSREIKDKIILIGVMAQSVKDFFYTPHSRRLRVGQQIPGVVLHAYMVNQLLRFAIDGTSPIVTASEKQEGLWILFWCMLGGAIGLWVRSPWRFTVVCSAGLFALFLSAYSAFLGRWWIPSVPPAMAWLISAAIVTASMSNREKRWRALLMQLFSRHVSKEVAETIWQQREQFLDGGRPRSQKLMVTVLFTDLKGFSSISEQMAPQSLMDWLNTYMESMAQIIIDHGGVIDDYAGDGIKANFGVPIPRKDEAEIRQDAINALNCTLAMEKEMLCLHALWQVKKLPCLGMRIGVFTGPVVAGPLGSSQRLKYTTVGDTVNIASRLESYDKELAKDSLCRILIGEATLRYLGGQFETQRVGEVSLKGKAEKITIYRVLGHESQYFRHKNQEDMT